MPNYPKPTALKLLEGNPGKRPLNVNEPQPDASIPDCPAFVKGEARKEWKRIVPELEKLGLLTRIDMAGLAAYCVAFGRWADAERELRKHGVTQTSPNGYVQTSAHLHIANKAMEQMHKFLVQFGLTPAARSRVSVSPMPDDDEARFFGT